MASKAFKTASKRGKPITFTLDDDEYVFTPPKTAGILMSVLEEGDGTSRVKAMFDWLDAGLPEDQSKKIIARLKDPHDDLDVKDLDGVMTWLMEKVTGRPTG